jgi:predicted O-methyltransferase YrrM
MSNLFFDAGPSASGQKVMLATTSYDNPDSSYVFSIASSREALHKAGVPTAYLLLQGNCHVDDARNTVVRDFLVSDCTDLVFLDADVSWEPESLVALCKFDCDLVGGVYPYRRDRHGKQSMPVRNLRGVYVPDESGLLEVEGLPTGFMRIRRHVLERMAAESPSFRKDASGPVPLLFERDIWNGERRGGDIHFCMKWRAMGGKLYAAAEMRLGHCGEQIVRDSLAANLRRQAGLTLGHVAEIIRDGKETAETYAEAREAMDNPWGAQTDVLFLAVGLARKARGPIIEAGSGLTTILMAAANPDQTVWCLEHHPVYALKLEHMAYQAGVKNIALVTCPIKDGWYDVAADLPHMPKRFAVGLIDGPPRLLGDRMKFFDVFGDCCEAFLADDADDAGYAATLTTWADNNGRALKIYDRAAVILKRAA